MRYLLITLLIAVLLFAGYQIGRIFTERRNETRLIENYALVKEIAELASIEVRGTTSFVSSNIVNDGSLSDELKRLLFEKTVRLTVPFTAKYGVDLGDSSLRIQRNDTLLHVYLPAPKLLSYEIHVDRLEANNQKGWFQFQNDATYTAFQKKMYAQSRTQLEKNAAYLQRSRDRVCTLIQKYFAPLNMHVLCVYEESRPALSQP
ncbi:MAG: DUF4230 domain-containing protein [Williamsia sp.]|nr:DUF4230 domain-containing protein [Williamsia sp.]